MSNHQHNLDKVAEMLRELNALCRAYSQPTAELARRARNAVKALHAGMSIPANTPKPKRKPCSQLDRGAWRTKMFKKIGGGHV